MHLKDSSTWRHIRSIHLIGALSPADVERLAIRLVAVSGERTGEVEPGEPLVSNVALACSLLSAGEGSITLQLSATARLGNLGAIESRFAVEVYFAKGRERSVDDPGSLELLGQLAWPPVSEALQQFAHVLTGTAEVRMRHPSRRG